MDPLALLSNVPGLKLLRLVIDNTSVVLFVEIKQADVACPLCTMPARRVHSRYTRVLADIPCAAGAPLCTFGYVGSFVITPGVHAGSLPSVCPP